MSRKSYLMWTRPVLLAMLLFLWCAVSDGEEGVRASGPLVKREQRSRLFSSEDGEISAVRVSSEDIDGSYLLHFFTLEPNSLFLPALLHADMVFYVHTGSGKLSWTEEGELKTTELTRGDVYRLEQGSFFFVQSNLETQTERQKLRIHALFADSDNALQAPPTGPYSSIRDIVLGFDREVLQAAFKEVIDELVNGVNQPAIMHGLPRTKKAALQTEAEFVKNFIGSRSYNLFELNKKKKTTKKKKKTSGAKLFNLFNEDKDFENCNGWSTAVTGRKLTALKGSDVGLFMVNLTTGSMMGPHWNPAATEIAVVLQGRGMIRVVCSSFSNETKCRNMRFEVEEGDVFAVPRFHPMSQISFNNETLVFMGFSTSARENHPQFLVGQASVFRTLDKDVLAMSFNVSNTTLDQLLGPQQESVILGCVSCAEEELRIMQEEVERVREEAKEREKEESERVEEERRREEEKARKKEEAAARKQEEERERREEEARQREQEEEERKSKEEAAKREKQERERREEEAREEAAKQEEQERERREEEERQREAAEAKEEEAKEEEEKARRREEEEKERERREEEEARQREEEAAKREEEEEGWRRHQEKEAARREGEAEREREQEEEARRRHQEEEEQGWRSEEERAAEAERRREESTQREEEEERRRGGEGEDQEWGRIILKNKRLTV